MLGGTIEACPGKKNIQAISTGLQQGISGQIQQEIIGKLPKLPSEVSPKNVLEFFQKFAFDFS